MLGGVFDHEEGCRAPDYGPCSCSMRHRVNSKSALMQSLQQPEVAFPKPPERCPVHLAGTQPTPIQCGFPPHKGGSHAGLNDADEVVWFPVDPVVEVAKEYGIRHIDGAVSIRSEDDARWWVSRYPRSSRLIYRTAPGPWQESRL